MARNPNKGPMSSRCDECPLRFHLPYVDGEGEGEKVIIIGKAPGQEERSTGRPFVGSAGQILRGVLNQLDLAPQDVRITNVVKCRPPGNRDPTNKEIEYCLPHLYDEIKDSPNARLLLLGNVPLHTLTDCKKGITRARGEWFDAWKGRQSLATFQPAYIARSKGNQYFLDFVADIQAALAGPVEFRETKWHMLDTVEAVEMYFTSVLRSKAPHILAWDLETSGYRFYQDYILAMSLSHLEGHGWVITEEMMRNEAVQAILVIAFAQPELLWIGHNAKFDQIFTLQHVGSYPVLYNDTMMMHLALDERKGTHDLKTLSRDLCGAPDWESVLWQYLDNREDTYAKVPRDVLYKYAAFDADYTLRIFNILDPQLDEDNVRKINEELLVPASWAMMLSEYGGVTVDLDDLDEWQVRLEDELEDDESLLAKEVKQIVRTVINKRLAEHNVPEVVFWAHGWGKLPIGWDKKRNKYFVKGDGGTDVALMRQAELFGMHDEDLTQLLCWKRKLIEDEFSAGSWQKVGALVYNVLGLEYLSGRDVRTRGQEFSTSSASLEPYARDYDAIGMVLGLRTKKKLKSTYVDGLAPDREGRVHPRWKMHATVTGRIGCTDPNVMNIPHEAGTRDFFIPSADHVLVHADYSQAELRLLGAYSAAHTIDIMVQSSELPEVAYGVALENFLVKCYRADRDLHTEVTIELYGDDWGYDERMIAKAFNFGLVYGRSARSIAEAFDIPIKEAQAQQQAFFDRMPQVRTFLTHLEDSVVTQGELQNCFGRKRRFPYVDSMNLPDLERQAKNFMMQSTASDCTLMSTVRLTEWFEENGWGRVLVFLHDSVMVEVPECAMRLTARKMHEIMTAVPVEYIGDLVPLKVDVGVGYAWGQLHDYDVEKGEVIHE